MLLQTINAIATRIITKFPTTPIYIEEVPTDFIRPSFFIQLIDGETQELNKELLRERMSFEVVYFAEQGELGTIDVEKQLQDFQVVRQLFQNGSLYIGELKRTAKLNRLYSSRREGGDVFITFDLELVVTREEKQEYELMRNLSFTMRRY